MSVQDITIRNGGMLKKRTAGEVTDPQHLNLLSRIVVLTERPLRGHQREEVECHDPCRFSLPKTLFAMGLEIEEQPLDGNVSHTMSSVRLGSAGAQLNQTFIQILL